MKTSDFWYELPPGLIAQRPIEKRDSSRLLLLGRDKLEHYVFSQLDEHLQEGDCLVLNNSRVLPARLIGLREGGGEAEVLLLNERERDLWECLVRPGRKLRKGSLISFGDGLLMACIIEEAEDGKRIIRFSYEGHFMELLDRLGQMPLPPYITEKLDKPERYQTVFAKIPGSAAAPTAGLHFTPELLERIKKKGVETAEITLHVGLGTFRPVKAERIEDHIMHSEFYSISSKAARAIENAKKGGGRIIAVGTTSCRTLESAAQKDGRLEEASGWTDIFIRPGYLFKMTDGLITNFHLPGSTLMMLVSALAGHERIMYAYKEAIKYNYRFFSFGDAMLIV